MTSAIENIEVDRARQAIIDGLSGLRVDVPAGLESAYTAYVKLLVELLRGEGGTLVEAERVRDELRAPGNAACFEWWICKREFERAIGMVLRLGAKAHLQPNLRRIWPATTEACAATVHKMVLAIMQWVLVLRSLDGSGVVSGIVDATKRNEPVNPAALLPRRPRGQPRVPMVDELARAVVREGLFPRGRPLARAIGNAVKLLPRVWTEDSLRTRVEAVRRKEVRIPEAWRNTLLAKRIEPLHSDDLKVTANKMRWAQVARRFASKADG